MMDRFKAESIWKLAYANDLGDVYCVVTDYLASDPGDGWECPPDPGVFEYRLEDEDGAEVELELTPAIEDKLRDEYESWLEREDGLDMADAMGVFDHGGYGA